MPKKIIPIDSYVSASVAAEILSAKMGFPIHARYIRELAKSKKQPVRTRPVSGHLLYNREDVMRCQVRKRNNGNN